ncbi:MAG: hypothetical protein J5752_10830 [Clostridiales bacterium]|nr:hypothetical protein [Clostridiales bacterium]
MKKSAFAAGILAISMLGCACEKKTQETRTSRTSAATKEETTEPEETSESEETEEMSGTSETTEATTTAESSESKDTSPTKVIDTSDTTEDTSAAPSETSAPVDFDFNGDPLTYYSSDVYKVPEVIACYLYSGTGSWHTSVNLSTKTGTFVGEYLSAMNTVDGDALDVYKCDFEGTMDTFTRINEYSFSTHVTDLKCKKFDDYEDEIGGKPAHVKFDEPWGFKEPDELIFYMPNAPKSELPEELLDWVKDFVSYPDTPFLGTCVVYNVKEKTGFITDGETIPELQRPTQDCVNSWSATFNVPEGKIEVGYDTGKGKPKAAVYFDNAGVFENMEVSMFKDDPSQILIYGTSENGNILIMTMSVGDGLTVVYVNNSTDPGIPEHSFYYPQMEVRD